MSALIHRAPNSFGDIRYEYCACRSEIGMWICMAGAALLALGIGATRGKHVWARGAATLPLFGGALLGLGGGATWYYWRPLRALKRTDEQRMVASQDLSPGDLWAQELASIRSCLDQMQPFAKLDEYMAAFNYEMARLTDLCQTHPPTDEATWSAALAYTGEQCWHRSGQVTYRAIATARWRQLGGAERCRQELLAVHHLLNRNPDPRAVRFHTARLAAVYEQHIPAGHAAQRIALLNHIVDHPDLRAQFANTEAPSLALGVWQAMTLRALNPCDARSLETVVLTERDVFQTVLLDRSWQRENALGPALRHCIVSFAAICPRADPSVDNSVTGLLTQWLVHLSNGQPENVVPAILRAVNETWRQAPRWQEPTQAFRLTQFLTRWARSIEDPPTRTAFLEQMSRESLPRRMTGWCANGRLTSAALQVAGQLAAAAQGLQLSDGSHIAAVAALAQQARSS